MRILTVMDRLIDQYEEGSKKAEANGQQRHYYARSRPYHSTQFLVADVIAANETNEANIAYAKFSKGQQLYFFDYGIGASIDTGAGTSRRATPADTNLVKAKSTNGASDYCIQALSLGVKDIRTMYSAEAIALITSSLDPQLVAALGGQNPIVDPGALVTPPQTQSPFNTEIPMWHGLQDNIDVELQWDGGTPSFKLGTAGMFPDASGKSQMRSSGMPQAGNYYQVPEGYIWARDGEVESEFIVQATLQQDIIVPINLSLVPSDSTVAVIPTNIIVGVMCRLWGTEFAWQGING